VSWSTLFTRLQCRDEVKDVIDALLDMTINMVTCSIHERYISAHRPINTPVCRYVTFVVIEPCTGLLSLKQVATNELAT